MFRNYTKIGRNGSADKFVRELGKTKSYSWETQAKNAKLIAGAVQAFSEGNSGNIQAALSNAKALEENWHYPDLVPLILFKASENSLDKPTSIDRALADVSANDRKELLNKALDKAIWSGIGGEAFYDLLLKSGADANATVGGNASAPLVAATCAKSPFPVIKLLYDSGASFDDAETTMHSQGRSIDDINRLEHYRKKLGVKKPSAPVAANDDEDIRESLREIKQQLRDLTAAFNALQFPVPEEPPEPVARRKPQQKPPYPSVP